MDQVRAAFRALRDRAAIAHPEHAGFVRELWASWDGTLALAADRLTPEGDRGIEALTRAAESARDGDLLDWMDVYPSGVYDRLDGGLFSQTPLGRALA